MEEFNVPADQSLQVLHALNRCGKVVYLGDKEKNSALADIGRLSFCCKLILIVLKLFLIVFLDCKWLADVMSSVVSLKTRVKDGILNEIYLMQVSIIISIV